MPPLKCACAPPISCGTTWKRIAKHCADHTDSKPQQAERRSVLQPCAATQAHHADDLSCLGTALPRGAVRCIAAGWPTSSSLRAGGGGVPEPRGRLEPQQLAAVDTASRLLAHCRLAVSTSW